GRAAAGSKPFDSDMPFILGTFLRLPSQNNPRQSGFCFRLGNQIRKFPSLFPIFQNAPQAAHIHQVNRHTFAQGLTPYERSNDVSSFPSLQPCGAATN
ncbi:MAG: hypothetical protein ABIQ85_09225, partial [Cypionkella sp.]